MKSISLALLSFVALAAARKNCVIPSSGGGDDSDAIIDTFKSCSTKSKVVFSAGTTYNVHKPMNISGLNDVHVSLEGNVLFSDDVPYWQSNVFLLNYQSAGTWWVFGGKKITIDGGGSINGNAQSWWNQKITTTRPVMLTFDKVQDLTVSGISLLQSPFWHMFVRDVTKAKFKKLLIKSVSNSTSFPPQNSDGWDLYRSSDITIQDCTVINSDDCVSFKPNATDITVKNVDCTGSHGLSIGSLGQYAADGEIDIVRDVTIKGVSCTNCQNGARIKTWPGGKGTIENIKFENMNLTNAENPIVITTHYCDNQQMDYCTSNGDESLTIKNIEFSKIIGSASSKGNPVVNLNCSTSTPCEGIKLSKINITPASNSKPNVCENVIGSESIAECQ